MVSATYRPYLPNVAQKLKPLTTLFKRGVKFEFTPAMEETVVISFLLNCPALRSSYIPIGMPLRIVRDGFAYIPMRAKLYSDAHLSRNNRILPSALHST